MSYSIEAISRRADQLKKRYHERDPRRLADAMGILVLETPMGATETCCKGFCMVQSRITVITLNSDLPEDVQRIVLPHELGHAVLHASQLGAQAFHDFDLFGIRHAAEYEANVFAAQLMLEDEEVISLLNGDMTFFAAAQTLGVPPELLDFKFRVLKQRGYHLQAPITTSGDYLRHFHAASDDSSAI